MNILKKMMTGMLLLGFLTHYSFGQQKQEDLCAISHKWSVLTTHMTGLVVGATTGALTRFTDDYFPMNWIVLWRMRKLANYIIARNAGENHGDVDLDSLNKIARLSDWIAYVGLHLAQ